MKQVPPPVTNTILSTVISSLVSLVVGIIGGGLAGYNGWKRNRLDTGIAHTQAEEVRLSKEAMVNQSTSTLINDALSLVRTLREEIDRLREENHELRTRLEELQRRLDRLERETPSAAATTAVVPLLTLNDLNERSKS